MLWMQEKRLWILHKLQRHEVWRTRQEEAEMHSQGMHSKCCYKGWEDLSRRTHRQHTRRRTCRQHTGRRTCREHTGRRTCREHTGRRTNRQHTGRRTGNTQEGEMVPTPPPLLPIFVPLQTTPELYAAVTGAKPLVFVPQKGMVLTPQCPQNIPLMIMLENLRAVER